MTGDSTPPGLDVDEAWQAHARMLFVRSVADLWERCSLDQRDVYLSLGAASVLRRLLLDATPLMDVINRPLRMRLTFTARPMHASQRVDPENPSHPDPGNFHSHGDCLDPEVACSDAMPVEHHTRASWLRHVVGEHRNGGLTVRDYIKYVAHFEGAVHLDGPKSAVERQIFLLDMAMAGGGPSGRSQNQLLRAIGRVTARGLQPLVDALGDAGTEGSGGYWLPFRN